MSKSLDFLQLHCLSARHCLLQMPTLRENRWRNLTASVLQGARGWVRGQTRHLECFVSWAPAVSDLVGLLENGAGTAALELRGWELVPHARELGTRQLGHERARRCLHLHA